MTGACAYRVLVKLVDFAAKSLPPFPCVLQVMIAEVCRPKLDIGRRDAMLDDKPNELVFRRHEAGGDVALQRRRPLLDGGGPIERRLLADRRQCGRLLLIDLYG